MKLDHFFHGTRVTISRYTSVPPHGGWKNTDIFYCVNDLAPHATEFLLRVCEPSDSYRYANGHRSIFYNESPLPCDPVTSESTTNIFAGPRDAPLSVCLFQPPLSSNKASVERWGFASVASFGTLPRSTRGRSNFQLRFSCDPCDSCHPPPAPPSAAAAAAATLLHPTNPTRNPTELVPPDDDSVDCFGSKLMSAAARFAQGAAGGM